MTTFPEMRRIVPEGSFGVATVTHFAVDKHQSAMTAFGGGRGYVPEGNYASLKVSGALVMSDTPYERRTNRGMVHRATGRVLIAGYGLGMVLTVLLKKPDVTEVVVVEKTPDVVALVDPHIRRYVGARAAKKLSVVESDVFEVKPLLKGKFNTLWFDIWGDVSTDCLAEMAALSRRFSSLKADATAFMGHWDRDRLLYRREQARRARW